MSLSEELFRAKSDLAALRLFAQELLAQWPDEIGIDGFDLQDLCVKHRLLTPTYPRGPCGQECWCRDYYGNALGSWIGAVCYRKTELLTGSREPVETKQRVSGVPYEVDLSEGGDHD